MSWDVIIAGVRRRIVAPGEQAQASDFEPLGKASTVREKISELLPGVDWQAPSWGRYVGDGFTIEFNAGDEDPISIIMLHVRGRGDPISAFERFVKPLGWSAFDLTTRDFIDFDDRSTAGW